MIESRHNASKKKPLKVEETNFPSLPAGPPPKTAQTQKRKPIMDMFDEPIGAAVGVKEESKGPAWNPFSGPPPSTNIGGNSQFATTVVQ